jgi:hypothetical protein
LTRKPNHFRGPLAFSSAMGRCMFCPGSGTKRAQSTAEEHKAKGFALILPATFADINIHKGRSVYCWWASIARSSYYPLNVSEETSLWFP